MYFLFADPGMDRRQREKHQSPAVHDAHCAVGRGDQVEARGHGRPGDARASEESVQEGCVGGAPGQGG